MTTDLLLAPVTDWRPEAGVRTSAAATAWTRLGPLQAVAPGASAPAAQPQNVFGGPPRPALQPREAAEFGLLKQRLLLLRLGEVANPECHAAIMLEAEVAAELACQTPFPLLVFPCLFEERAGAAMEQARQWALHYWRGVFVEP